MDFRILGPLQVEGGDGPLHIAGRLEQVLLALLVVNAGRVVSVDRMIEELWGDDAPPTAVKTLRSHISKLRRQLGPEVSIETRRPGYLLEASPETIDASRFEQLLRKALDLREHGETEEASLALRSALAEWRGRALLGLDDHAFAQMEAARLDSMRLEALEARIASDLDLGRAGSVVAELERLVDEFPHREVFWGLLMLALYQTGRQADALAAYNTAKTRLGEDLGIEPSEELRKLEEQILLQDAQIRQGETPRAPGHNLPRTRDSFVGRTQELAAIAQLLDQTRLITLSGVGGSGKTRLGMEAARAALESYPDGVRWVELATIIDPEALAEHILLVFGEPGSHSDDPAALLAELLGQNRLLLVLDNCEHIVGPAASLADRLLDRCANLSMLVTSRQSLGIPGETVFAVPTLAVPEVDAPAEDARATESVRLLIDRVRAYDRGFDVTTDNVAAVTTICRQLDGIPLAIELAASRMRTMTSQELADRIDQRFDLLTKGSRTAPPRQQTLRAAIEWSYELLSRKAQAAFRAMGVFAGSWTIQAAEAVVAEDEASTLGLIDELVDKSLVERFEDGRFRLLETIRQFAFELLVLSGTAPSVGRRHRDWYLAAARAADPLLRNERQVEAWRRLERDHDNLRAAIRWSLDNDDSDGALALVAALGYFWMVRGFWREAWRWLDRALAAPSTTPLARARAIVGEAITEVIRVNVAAVDDLIVEAGTILSVEDDPENLARAELLHAIARNMIAAEDAHELLRASYEAAVGREDYWTAAFAARYLGDSTEPEAILWLEESFDRFMVLGDRWNAAFSMYFISGLYVARERYEEGQEAAWRARKLASEVGDVIWYAHATRNLGLAAMELGEVDRAKEFMMEALERLAAIGDDACSATLNRGLARIALQDGHLEESARLMGESGRSAMRLGSTIAGGVTLWQTAELAVVSNEVELAVELAAVAAKALSGREAALGPTQLNNVRRIDDMIDEQVDAESRHAITRRAESMTIDQALAKALKWCADRASATTTASV